MTRVPLDPRPDVPSPAASSSSGTVTVALKMPFDLMLHVDELVEVSEQVPGGPPRTVQVARTVDPRKFGVPDEMINGTNCLVAHGWNHRWQQEGGFIQQQLPSCPGMFGLTHNVPAAFWTAWVEQHKDMHLVRDGLLFAYSTPADTEAACREREKMMSGLEPINPDSPPRIGVGKLQIAKFDGPKAA